MKLDTPSRPIAQPRGFTIQALNEADFAFQRIQSVIAIAEQGRDSCEIPSSRFGMVTLNATPGRADIIARNGALNLFIFPTIATRAGRISPNESEQTLQTLRDILADVEVCAKRKH